MISVERTRTINASVENVRAALSDPQQLQQIIPGVRSVEIVSRTTEQARVVVTTGLTLPGADRIEGDAIITKDGTQFSAVEPVPMSLHLTAVPHNHNAEVTARIETEIPPALGAMARFIPQHVIEQRIGAELDRALERLERGVRS